MAIVFYDEKGKVGLIHKKPEKLSKERRSRGIEVLDIPQPQQQEGKKAVLYYDKVNGLYYKYVDIPKTKEELLEEKVSQLENYILSSEGVI
ncbi:hypothetical protein [Maledivibacter halophilus]|uniref:Uncharacterized protein n=1 Tax=Maledivibacter halophilus TaxID=36842 RepID=A0A1T5M433_9FIRM|nr:hypothetical protein [Maledivibacter halophilus]SKC82885.1 hypothetical protein SAMN02194393_03769 [Maledivibacter halophilus]